MTGVDGLRMIASGRPLMNPLALVVAHQDDESIAAAGVMNRFRAMTLIHLSEGGGDEDENSTVRTVRREEVDVAMRVAAAGISRRLAYEFPDGRLPQHISAMADRLFQDLMAVDIVVTHPYEGGHCDHDAAAQAVQLACARMASTTGRAPVRLEFSSYFKFGGDIKSGEFVPGRTRTAIISLDAAAQRRKQAVFACFRSQTGNLGYFSTKQECFRVAPVYDFSRAPGLAA